MASPLHVGIIAGEASGDTLGAGLMAAIQARYPDARFSGIGGPQMLALGFQSLYPMERLSVMGLVEPLKRLPELLRIRRDLGRHFLAERPAVVVGIDSPDFNLGLALRLRRAGLKTCHYVSPSVWAWRQGRIRKIAKAVDHMLVLFPFEADFYHQHGVPATVVGHPLADTLPLEPDQAAARQILGLPAEGRILALMPGSRGGEVAHMGADFLATGRWCCERLPGLQLVLPAASPERKQQLQALIESHGQGLPLRLLDGQARLAMAAADAVLMASGTTTLEALLLKRPMVVAYRMAWLSYAIVRRLVKAPFISLPNLLAGRELVPERLQDEVCADVLGPLLLTRLTDSAERLRLHGDFTRIHESLRRDASRQAARVVLELAGV
ncbi:MAG TPA: lipid-A-disaccharide synthase [Spongiibacteraceae bacterium]|jgi:lipid-A-disaccharide synthase|nr:lipid-A-disaccharide synthase [Spongiibacteraceae bacterium]HUH37573.1 lipid-A-disaccharide synthase [Spongiibacteraceae bacterium]